METQITNPTTFFVSCLASGLLSGLIGGVCCCLPLFSGIGSLALYQYIERRPLSISASVIASLLSGLLAAIPASLLNFLAWFYANQHKEMFSPETKPFLEAMGNEPDFVGTFLSISLLFTILSSAGTNVFLIVRSATSSN